MKRIISIPVYIVALLITIWLYTGFQPEPISHNIALVHNLESIEIYPDSFTGCYSDHIPITKPIADQLLCVHPPTNVLSSAQTYLYDLTIGIGIVKKLKLDRLLLPVILTQKSFLA
jgi:hypothetical protein